jgi:hypothetical protein
MIGPQSLGYVEGILMLSLTRKISIGSSEDKAIVVSACIAALVNKEIDKAMQ